MKKSRHVALWITGTVVLAACHRRATSLPGGPNPSPTPAPYWSYHHWFGGGGVFSSGSGSSSGSGASSQVERGGFGSRGAGGGHAGE